MVYIEKFQKNLYRCAYPCSNVKKSLLIYLFAFSNIAKSIYHRRVK